MEPTVQTVIGLGVSPFHSKLPRSYCDVVPAFHVESRMAGSTGTRILCASEPLSSFCIGHAQYRHKVCHHSNVSENDPTNLQM